MKKLLSFILAVLLLAGLSSLFVNAEESADYFFIPAKEGVIGAETYGFRNSDNWDNVYVYATGGRSEYEGGMIYPGEKLERRYVDGYGYIYTFSFAVGYYSTLLFNDGTTDSYTADLEKDFYDYCVAELGSDSLYDGAKVVITDTRKVLDDAVLFTASGWVEPEDAGCYEVIGNYCVHRSATYSPYDLGIYISSNDRIYTLSEAFAEKVINTIPADHGFSDVEFHRLPVENTDANLFHRCLYAFGDRYGYEPDKGESIYCQPYGYVDDCVLFHAYYSHCAYPSMNTSEQIGDYYFYKGSPCGIGENNSVALYVMSPEGDVFTLYEAYTMRLVTDMDTAAELAGGVSIFGDYGRRILELVSIDTTADSWSHLYGEIKPFYEGYKWYEEPPQGTVADFVVVFAAESTVDEAPSVKRIGRYAVGCEHTYAPDALGYYVYFPKEDKAYSIEEAYEAYPQYSNKMIRLLDYSQSGHYRLIGDAEHNANIDIKDATRIQKRIAGLDLGEVYGEHLELEASDFNGDGKVDVRDATAIQKRIAGLEY